MAELAAPSSAMFGARAAMSDGMPHIEEQVRALERAVVENTGLAFDLSRTLVESACKTILKERGSHGSDGPRPALESVQALLAAQAADAIVGFLHRVHRQERMAPARALAKYEESEDFNAYVDEANEIVRIFELEYRPSEVLFSVDENAYRDLLASYEPDTDRESDVVGEETETR